MNVQLQPFNFEQALARAGLKPPSPAVGALDKAPGAAPAGTVVSFSGALTQALSQVSASQKTASALQREVTMDNPQVSLEETMVAMQKAQVGFQATLAVRNRLVQAYSEIMNMQV